MTDWEAAGAPVTAEALADVERLIGPLPFGLRTFYAAHNGGWPVTDTPHPLGVHGYHPIDASGTSVGALYAELVAQDDRFAGLLPFAYDAGGNTFLVSLREGDDAAPRLWLHQTSELLMLECSWPDLLPDGGTGDANA